ncbi:hypothetical protein NW841_02080 [Synechococcus sp. H60.3]
MPKEDRRQDKGSYLRSTFATPPADRLAKRQGNGMAVFPER